jgi:hypothetical protein
MIKQKEESQQKNLYYNKLIEIINDKHELVKLAQIILWNELNASLEKHYRKDFGRPTKSIRFNVNVINTKADEQSVG